MQPRGPSTDILIEIPLEEKVFCCQKEGQYTGSVDDDYRPEGCLITNQLRDDATNKNTKSHTDVPRNEDSGIRCTPLIVSSRTDGHILESGPHVAVAETY